VISHRDEEGFPADRWLRRLQRGSGERYDHPPRLLRPCAAQVRLGAQVPGQETPRQRRRATKGLVSIQKLYRIERLVKDAAPQERQRYRNEQARPLIDEIRQWLDAALPEVPPTTATGKALNYLHNEWPKLARYTEDGRLAIDNNRIENAIRPFVVGRKNRLFSDTVNGVKASTCLYSLIETAKADALEPYAYLRYVFTDLPRTETVKAIEALLPGNIVNDQISRF
jgi:transposase